MTGGRLRRGHVRRSEWFDEAIRRFGMGDSKNLLLSGAVLFVVEGLHSSEAGYRL